ARVEGLAGPARSVEAGGDVKVALGIDGHAVAAAAGGEVVNRAVVRQAAVGLQVVCADLAGAAGPAVGVDQVEGRVAGRDGQAVRHVDLGRGDNPRERA